MIGWIAKTYPDVVRKIAEKYQIGCHTMNHQLVWQQSREEFPVCFKTIAGKHLVFSGGGYFRLFPYPLIKKWSKECHTDITENTDISLNTNRKNLTNKASAGGMDGYLLAYIHPRDLDGGQPVLEGLPLARRFKSYVGLKGAEPKLRRWLKEFSFVDIATANQLIDWDKAQRFAL